MLPLLAAPSLVLWDIAQYGLAAKQNTRVTYSMMYHAPAHEKIIHQSHAWSSVHYFISFSLSGMRHRKAITPCYLAMFRLQTKERTSPHDHHFSWVGGGAAVGVGVGTAVGFGVGVGRGLHDLQSAGGEGWAGVLSATVTLIVWCFPSSVRTSRMASIMSISQSLRCRNRNHDSSVRKKIQDK